MFLLLFEKAAFCVQYFLCFKQSWLLLSNLAGYLQDWVKHGFYIIKWLKNNQNNNNIIKYMRMT